jgi:hypothetical protein
VQTQQAGPEADAVATNFLMVADSEGTWPPSWPASAESDEMELITDLPRRWMVGQSLCSSSVAVRTQRLHSMQPCFPPGESQAEDLDFWFRLGEQTPIALAHAPLVAYRVEVDGSLTSGDQVIAMPPSLERMEKRALSGATTPAQRQSTLWFINQHKLTLARMSLSSNQRMEAVKWLLRGRGAIDTKRWWVTASMTCFFPKSMVTQWERWRTSQRYLHDNMTDSGN